MKKRYKLENLDCANCAMKMEREIQKLEGIKSISINFMMETLVIDIDDSLNIDLNVLLKEIDKICSKVDSGCHVIIK